MSKSSIYDYFDIERVLKLYYYQILIYELKILFLLKFIRQLNILEKKS